MTDVQVYDSSDGAWRSIDYGNFQVTNAVSDVQIAPKARIDTHSSEDIGTNQELRIREDGATIFRGFTTSSGDQNLSGQRKVSVEHEAYQLFDENVDIDLTSPTTLDVLQAALQNSNKGIDFSISYDGTATSLDNDYSAENRSVKHVFRDITDRTSRVWWVDVDNTIYVQPYSARSTWESFSFPGDDGGVVSYNSGDVSTVRNDVTVNGTGEEQVSRNVTHSSSIDQYGRRAYETNVEYITTTSEAHSYAQELLITEPLAEAEVVIPLGEGSNPTQNLSNYRIGLSDESKGIDLEYMVIEKQVIEQGQITLHVGEGSGVSLENINRESKSRQDTTDPGTVYSSDRIADQSIVESKLDDLAVSVNKIQDEAIAEAKVMREAITETKINSRSISTPKLQSGAITAGKIDSEAVRTSHLEAEAVESNKIAADTVGASHIISSTITADEIDVIDLDTHQLSIGQDTGSAFHFDSQDNYTKLVPGSDGTGYIGDSNTTFSEIWGNSILGRNAQIGGIDRVGAFFPSSANNEGFEFEYYASTGEPVLRPYTDNTAQLGHSGQAFHEVQAYNFIDASDGTTISDGGDPLEGLASMDTPPEFCRDDSGENVSMNTLTNWLFDVAAAQQRRIEDLEGRLEAVEDHLNIGPGVNE